MLLIFAVKFFDDLKNGQIAFHPVDPRYRPISKNKSAADAKWLLPVFLIIIILQFRSMSCFKYISLSQQQLLLLSFFAAGWVVVFYTFFQGRSGQTPGQRKDGVMLMTASEDAPAGYMRALVRISFYAALIFAWLIIILISDENFLPYFHTHKLGVVNFVFLTYIFDAVAVLLNSRNRRLSDYMAGTVYVRVKSQQEN